MGQPRRRLGVVAAVVCLTAAAPRHETDPAYRAALARAIATEARANASRRTNWTALGPPDFGDVAYGPYRRQKIDVWLTEFPGARPMVVYVHGGGWVGGDKTPEGDDERWHRSFQTHLALGRGAHWAAINYRLNAAPDGGGRARPTRLPTPVLDVARAIQFLRSKAATFRLAVDAVGLAGPSAGGCAALYLAFRDDLARPDARDAVARSSTKPKVVFATDAQTSLDPVSLVSWGLARGLDHAMIRAAVGAASRDDLLENYSRYAAVLEEHSPITHVDTSDPPVILEYGRWRSPALPPIDADHAIHHPEFGRRLRAKANAVGHGRVSLTTADDAAAPLSAGDAAHPWRAFLDALLGEAARPPAAASHHLAAAKVALVGVASALRRGRLRGGRRPRPPPAPAPPRRRPRAPPEDHLRAVLAGNPSLLAGDRSGLAEAIRGAVDARRFGPGDDDPGV